MRKLQSLVREFALRRGIEPPSPDDQGVFEIGFDPDLRVRCIEWFENLHLVSRLAMPPDPPMQRREWFGRLMNYALHRMKRSRSTPALSDDGSVTLFARSKLAGMTASDFEAQIEEHLNSVDSYRNVLGAAEPPAPLETLPHSIVRP